MKTLITMAFALVLGAFVFGTAGHSNASPATVAAVAATQAEAVKADVTPVYWRYHRRCYTYRTWHRRYWRRAVCAPCCGTRLGFLFF
jgi:hypothetical protein